MRGDNRPYLYAVDHLRAFAVVLVVLYHSTQIISQAINPDTGWSSDRWLHSRNPLATIVFEGHTGVALFMVLSGFIFTTGTLDKDVAYWPFLRNRLLRIYPLYLVLLFVGVSSTGGAVDLGTFFRGLLPLSSFGPVAVGGVWGMMFWAVAVEMQFYLVFPLLLRLLQRSGPAALGRLVLAMVVLRALAWAVQPDAIDLNATTYYSIVGRLDQFLIGMLAGWLYIRRARPRTAPVLLGVGAVAVTGLLWCFNQLDGMVAPAWWRVVWVDVEGAAWAVVVVGLVWTVRGRAGLISRAIAAVGERSYSLYLLHLVVVTLVASRPGLWVTVGGPVSSALVTGVLVVLPMTAVVSWFTYSAVERPFLRMRGTYVRDQGDRTAGSGRRRRDAADGSDASRAGVLDAAGAADR